MTDPSWKDDLPPIPKWNLVATADAARELYFASLRLFAGATITPPILQEIVESVMAEPAFLQLQTAEAQLALFDTLTQDIGVVLTLPILKRVAYQVACNLDKLGRGEPLPRFVGVAAPQWLPLEIVGVEAGIVVGGKQLMSLAMLILAGTHAGYTPRKDCPFRYLPVMARDLGYSRRRPYEQTSHLLGLRLAAWVEPSDTESLKFEHFWVNSSMKKHNGLVIQTHYPKETDDV